LNAALRENHEQSEQPAIITSESTDLVLLQNVETYGVLLEFAFLLGLPMFMLLMFMLLMFMLLMFMLLMFMFAGMLAFALFVLAVPVLALAGVAAMFALPAVFELSAVVQPAKRTATVSKSTKAMVRRIEIPPVCIRFNGDRMSKRIAVELLVP